MTANRLVIASSQDNVGLSSIFMGLLVYLRESGISVKADVIGNSLIKTTHFRRVTGKVSLNISPTFLTKQQIVKAYQQSLHQTELHCLFCQKLEYLESLSQYLDATLFVVYDARKESPQEVVSKISNLNQYKKVGLIANYVENNVEGDYQIGQSDTYKLVGTIPDQGADNFAGDSSLGFSKNFSLLTRNQLLRLKGLITKHFDLKEFRNIYEQSRGYEAVKPIKLKNKFNVAIADDTAFHLSFQDNINSLYFNGANVIPFSPLADDVLPDDVNFIYFPSAYIALYLTELMKNKKMIKDIRTKIDSGVFAYFEGDSIAYACKKLKINGAEHEMCGFLNLGLNYKEVSFNEKYQRTRLDAINNNFFIEQQEECMAYTTDSLSTKQAARNRLFNSSNVLLAGITEPRNTFFTSSLLHWGSNGNIAKNIINNCR